MVSLQMMNITLTPHLEQCESLHFGTHKREYCLLFVSQIHHHRIIFGSEQVNDSELHTIEVLHFIYLNPLITLTCIIGTVDVVSL